jgi:hypothetical protein
MQVQKVGRAVVRFKDRQIFGSKMDVSRFAGQNRKEETEIGVVTVQEIKLPKVQRVVAGHHSESRR